ncbi:hypothetical protein IJH15_01240 [Candidatus Saccharibacteria bacterium]|nr:hypothetical protein [Candidatus Saccharibacteria bacterium]
MKKAMDIIFRGDVPNAVEMFEAFGLKRDGAPPGLLDSDARSLVQTTLACASSQSRNGKLSDDLANDIIERMAMTVNIFGFLSIVQNEAESEVNKFGKIPKTIRDSLCHNSYSDEIASVIKGLSEKQFESLISFIASGIIKECNVRFNLPIIRRIYEQEMIPRNAVLSYMGLFQRETVEVVENRSSRMSGPFLALEDLLNAMLF